MLNPRRHSLWWAWGMYWSWLSSVVVVRWRCRPLASSVGVVIGVGVVRGRWRRPLASSLALASSVGVGVVRGRWRRLLALSLALASSVGVVIGVGVVRWRWRRPLASLASSVGVGVVHWLVNGCERTWALVTVVGASGMGWSGVACRRWWCWLVLVASPVDVVDVVVVEEETASQRVTLALC